MLLREEADLVDRCWCELVDGEEMKLRVGVLLGLELGFLGVFCSAAATAIDCHIDRGQSKAAGFFFCFSSINVTFACAVGTLLEQHLLAFIHTKLSTPAYLVA